MIYFIVETELRAARDGLSALTGMKAFRVNDPINPEDPNAILFAIQNMIVKFSSPDDLLAIQSLKVARLREIFNSLCEGVEKPITQFLSRVVLSERLFALCEKSAQPLLAADPMEPVKAPSAKKKADAAEKLNALVSAAIATKGKHVLKRKPRSGVADPIIAFGVLPTSNRARALNVLKDQFGFAIELPTIAHKVYGRSDREDCQAAYLLLTGLMKIQESTDLAVNIVRSKSETGVFTYALFPSRTD